MTLHPPSTPLIVRLMQESDADAVRKIDQSAFESWVGTHGQELSVSLRSCENILAARAAFPQGCFVAEDPGTGLLAGFVFSRVWGQVGWVGTFGVLPAWQNQHLGQRMISDALRALEAAGCTTMGLETMPDSTYNIGLYTNLGFQPITMTLSLDKTVQRQAESGPSRGFRVGSLEDLDHVTRISQAAWAELDLAAEVENALRFGWGELLLFQDSPASPWAIALLRLTPRRENTPNPVCEVSALAIGPLDRQRLGDLLPQLESYAAGRGFSRLRISLNTADWESLRLLLGSGFRVGHSALRLTICGQYQPHAGIEFNRWAM